MPTTGSGLFPYPNSSAVPDVPADLLLLAQRIELIASGWTLTANATTRAALVTNGNAYEGLHVYQIDTGILYIYLSSAWVSQLAGVSWSMKRAATQSLTNTTYTTIDFDTAGTSGLGFSESAGTITCSVAGTYRIDYRVQFAANAVGARIAKLRVGGVDTNWQIIAAGTNAPTAVSDFAVLTLAASNTIDIQGYQASGGALNVASADVIITSLA